MGFSTVSAYVIGGVSMLVLLGLSAWIANLIRFQIGDNRSDALKRRVWFWILAVLVPLVTFAVTYFTTYSGLKVPTQKEQYFNAMCISAAVFFVVYILLGVLLSLAFKKSKIGDWFKF